MRIPDEIKRVERPSSTIVRIGMDGRYLVIKRGSKRIPGKKNPVPYDIGTIGEIKDGKYIEIRKEPRSTNINSDSAKNMTIDIKSYGCVKLAYDVSYDLLEDLRECFNDSISYKLYIMSLLRAIDPDLKSRDIEFEYMTSCISNIIDNQNMNKNNISKLLKVVGMNYSSVHSFLMNRVEKYSACKTVIDGTVKRYTSDDSIYSEYSRKAHEKTGKDVSILYQYNLGSKEPIALKIYPGNELDQTSINDFLEEFKGSNSLCVLDKGFYTKKNIIKWDSDHSLSYLLPIKDNSKIIKDNDVLNNINTPLKEYKERVIYGEKFTLDDNHYLYAYRDPKIALDQEVSYTSKGIKNNNFDSDKYVMKKDSFGTIVLYSNSDLSLIDAYIAYSQRWEIETMFNLFKVILDIDTTNVHSDYSTIVTEFVNFLSVIIATRIKHKFDTTTIKTKKNKDIKLSRLYSYRQLLRYLRKIQIYRTSSNGDWIYNKNVAYVEDIGKALNIYV